MRNKIVLHYLDGQILKGTTCNFSADKEWFHLTKRNTGQTIKVNPSQLKGVFFVKSFDGNRAHRERYGIHRPGLGRKVSVSFKDGENVIGHTTGVSPDKKGFFVFFSDPISNNEKVFVLTAATHNIRLV
ncbi:MAG: hypothetical protein EPO39_02875 [Candidatus Manganitrophaceae bacterium]|nr:MAG: hypothetical protein EPO39_02875 [Candidatus Manganitrophaceae bacterium]